MRILYIGMLNLQKLQEANKDNLLMLTVNVGESKENVQKFMEENNLDSTVLNDEKPNGVRSYPTNYNCS